MKQVMAVSIEHQRSFTLTRSFAVVKLLGQGVAHEKDGIFFAWVHRARAKPVGRVPLDIPRSPACSSSCRQPSGMVERVEVRLFVHFVGPSEANRSVCISARIFSLSIHLEKADITSVVGGSAEPKVGLLRGASQQ